MFRDLPHEIDKKFYNIHNLKTLHNTPSNLPGRFREKFTPKVERNRVYLAVRLDFWLNCSLDFSLPESLVSMLLRAKHKAINYGPTIFVFVDALQ